MADIALLYPHFRTHARDEMLFHPLGIARLAAILRSFDVSTLVVDCTFRRLDDVLAELVDAKPRIVGIYVMISISDNAVELARSLRDLLPDSLLVCGGPLPTLRPDRFARDFDLVFRGEADNSFPRFCTDYLAACKPQEILAAVRQTPEAYPGVYYPYGGENSPIQSSPEPLDELSLNHLPIPDRNGFDHLSYQRFWSEKETFASATIMTSYGCPYDCDFCSKPVFGNHLRFRDMDRIAEEIQDVQSRGYTGLWIGDDCFTLNMDHVRAFCERLLQDRLEIKWTCLSRTDRISANDVKAMRDAGCEKVCFGLESGNNDVLKLMNKSTTVEGSEQVVRLFSESGIRTVGFFIVGYPGETYDTIERTFAWALSLPLDEISFTVPYPLPGTRLYDRVHGVREDADWLYENENRFFYKSEFDERYLNQRIQETYAQFESRSKAVAH
jgi:anaerobic magnesium-protoporphyrin IX monomethyl ester cyclase